MTRQTRQEQVIGDLIRSLDDPKEICERHGVSCETALQWIRMHFRDSAFVDYDAELGLEHLEAFFHFDLLYRVDRLPGGSTFLSEVERVYEALLAEDQYTEYLESKREAAGHRGTVRSVEVRQERGSEAKSCYKQQAKQLMDDYPYRSWTPTSLAKTLEKLAKEKKINCQYRKWETVRKYLT